MRYIYLALGWFSVGLAIIGIILPVLPTVPFLLVAVWAFSKSSPVLAERIRNHKTFGPLVRDWQDHGAIPFKAKALAVFMMSCTGGYLLFYGHAPQWLAVSICVAMACVAIFIVSRPTKPPAF